MGCLSSKPKDDSYAVTPGVTGGLSGARALPPERRQSYPPELATLTRLIASPRTTQPPIRIP